MLTPVERTAFSMLEKGQFLNGDHPLVVLHDAAEARAEELDALRAKVAALTKERDQAIAHDRQPYPTAWAYEQACKALDKARTKVAALEEDKKALWQTVDWERSRAEAFKAKVAALEAERDVALAMLREKPWADAVAAISAKRDAALTKVAALEEQLRSQIEILEEPAPRATLDRLAERVRSGEWGCARCAALEEAGDGLARGYDDPAYAESAECAADRARWREVKEGK